MALNSIFLPRHVPKSKVKKPAVGKSKVKKSKSFAPMNKAAAKKSIGPSPAMLQAMLGQGGGMPPQGGMPPGM